MIAALVGAFTGVALLGAALAPAPTPAYVAIAARAAKRGLPSPPGVKAPPRATTPKVPVESPRSEPVARVADWVAASNENGSLPYVIIDKPAASIRLFDAKGQFRGEAPVLTGVAIGDEATPGVGNKKLAELGPAEKTTPAGRFVARYGLPIDGERVLWVDYGISVAMHPIPKGTQKEHRRERMLSPTPDDNRITFGCINVPLAFYNGKLRPFFRRKGGIVYILPDTKPLEEIFPRLHARPFVGRP